MPQPLDPIPGHAWQAPVSQQSQVMVQRMHHYMPVTVATNGLVAAACGELFNAGFAERATFKSVTFCRRCKHALELGLLDATPASS